MLDLLENKVSKVELYNGFYAEIKKGCFFVKKNENIEISVETELIFKENLLNNGKINKLLLKNAVDYDKIIGELHIRNRTAGDKLRLKSRGITKAVRRLQQELSVDSALREKMPLAADDKGVFWGYLIGVDERVLVDENSKNILIFEVFEN